MDVHSGGYLEVSGLTLNLLYPQELRLIRLVLEMLISRSGCSFGWLSGGIGVDPKPAFPTRITFDPVGFGDVDISEWMFIRVVIWRYRG